MTIKSFNNLSSKARAVNYDASAPLAAIPGLQVQQGSPSLANATNEATLYSFLPNTNGENLSKIVDNNQPFLFASDNQALGIIVNAPLALDVSATSTTQLTAMPQLAVSVSAPPEKDITAPVLSAEGTLNNRINVSLTDNLQVVFSENIQLSDGVIELHNAADNSLVESFTNGVGSEGGVLTTSKGRGITLNPIADLSLDTRYYLTFSDHVIKDLAGNAFAGIADAQTLDFTTIKPDIDAPKLLPFNAQNSGNNVAKTIAVEFNEQVLLGSGTIELHQATDGSLVDTFSNGVSANGNIIRASGSKINIAFNQDLSPATQYYLTFSGDAVSDVAGNAFAGSVDPGAFNFTTPSPDLKAPVLYNLNPQGVPGGMVVDFPSIPSMTPILPILNDQYFGLTPVNNQTNVSLTGDFTLSFDENVQLGAGDIVLHNASDGSVVETFTNGIGSTGGYTATSKTSVIINPSADLTPATQYYLTIADTAISDTAGNAFAGFSDPGTLSFTSLGQDLQAPIFYGLYAYSDQNPKLNSTTITLNFNEAVQLGSGDVVLHKTSDNSVVESFTHGMGSADGYISTPYYNGFNIVTYAPLIAGEDYYVTLADNAITDKAGNAVASVADTTTLKFTQQQPFVYTPPGNQAFTFLGSGLDNQVGVPVNSDIQLGFSHALNLGSGAIVLHNVTDNSIVETFSNGAGSEGGTVMVNGYGVVVNPAANLAPATQYYLTVDDGAISDTAGESFAGFVDADTLNFFTAGVDRLPPKLIGANPVDDKHFLLAFDETVQLGNGSIELHKLADHSLIESFNQGVGSAGGNVTVSKSGVVINPLANLDPATQYYFTVSDTAITDLVGNAFAGIDNPNQLSFSTLMPDQQAPLLINSSPLDNQTNVANPTINMTFNEEVKFGVGAITLHKAADGSVVETFIQGQGSVGDNAVINGTFVSVNPSLIQYEPATQYYITVADNALTDKAGNAFAGFTDPTRLNFTTASPDTKAPELISASPIDNQTHIGVNVDINLNFNEALRFGNGHIELHNMADDSLVESFVQGVGSAGGTINVDALSSGTLIINPAADLLLGTQYYLTVAGDAITDLNGNAYSGFVDPYSLNFKTTADPDAVSSGSVTGFELSLSSSDAVALVGVHDLPAALY